MELNLSGQKAAAAGRVKAEKKPSATLQTALKMRNLVQSQCDTGHWRNLRQCTSGNKACDCGALKPESCRLMYFILGGTLPLTLLYLYILCFTLFTGIASDRYMDFSLRFLCISAGLLVLNAVWMAYALHEIRFTNRWKKYYRIFQHRDTELLDNIAGFTEFRKSTVRKDLKSAVKKGLICGGFFLKDGTVFSTLKNTQYVPDQTCHCAPESLAYEIEKLQAQCEGTIEISQVKCKLPGRLQREIQNVLGQYCYEIQAHSPGKENTGALLDIYIDIIDLVLYDNSAPLQYEKTLDTDRIQILNNMNAVFMGLLSESCQG